MDRRRRRIDIHGSPSIHSIKELIGVNCDVPNEEPQGLLAAIRTEHEHHADHDRLGFQFGGA
jgi:hypothetical protein